VPEIESLSLEIQKLNHSVEFWNNAIIVSLVFTAFAAIFVGVTTWVAFKKASLLATAQGNLSQLKDVQLRKDLKNKDVEIASTNERAARAEEQAAKANLELEKLRTPRTIGSHDRAEIIEAIKEFSGTPYDLSAGTDSESVQFMKTMQSLLNDSGWKQLPFNGPIGITNTDPLVGISLNSGINVEIAAVRVSRWSKAMDKLVGILKAKHVVAAGIVSQTDDANAVHIMVGKKP